MCGEKYRKAEYVQCRVLCKALRESSLRENVVFSLCARMGSAAYIMFITWNSISGLEPNNISGLTSVVVWLSR